MPSARKAMAKQLGTGMGLRPAKCAYGAQSSGKAIANQLETRRRAAAGEEDEAEKLEDR